MAAVKLANVAAAALVLALGLLTALTATTQVEAPASSPTSPASDVSLSILYAGAAAVAALVFGSALKI